MIKNGKNCISNGEMVEFWCLEGERLKKDLKVIKKMVTSYHEAHFWYLVNSNVGYEIIRS